MMERLGWGRFHPRLFGRASEITRRGISPAVDMHNDRIAFLPSHAFPPKQRRIVFLKIFFSWTSMFSFGSSDVLDVSRPK